MNELLSDSRVLYLTIKGEYYDMIASGEKPDEYRSIKPFWIKRLLANIEHLTSLEDIEAVGARFKHFDAVCFARGGHFDPRIPQMTLECKGITIDFGKPEWGSEANTKYFVIKLGKVLSATTWH